MRSLIAALLILPVLMLNGSAQRAQAAAGGAPNGTTVVMRLGSSEMLVNGQAVAIDEEGTTPLVQNGRVMLPIRAIAEALGLDVEWNPAEGTITIRGNFENSPEEAVEEKQDMMKLNVTINNQQFSASLYDNAATREWVKQLPKTYAMSELNGNEIYNYLGSNLPTAASRPEGINAGDIMLYGSDCLVLFYESFDTVYSYTPLGYLDDPTGLAAAVGRGAVSVSFALAE